MSIINKVTMEQYYLQNVDVKKRKWLLMATGDHIGGEITTKAVCARLLFPDSPFCQNIKCNTSSVSEGFSQEGPRRH